MMKPACAVSGRDREVVFFQETPLTAPVGFVEVGASDERSMKQTASHRMSEEPAAGPFACDCGRATRPRRPISRHQFANLPMDPMFPRGTRNGWRGASLSQLDNHKNRFRFRDPFSGMGASVLHRFESIGRLIV